MKSKYVLALTSIVLAGLIGLVGFGYMIQQNPKAFLVFAVGSQPDSYGNKIISVRINQNRGGSPWYYQIVYTSYESGQTVEIIANYPTTIGMEVMINATLVSGSPEDVVRAYLSISGVKTNEAMSIVDSFGPYGSGPGAYYYVDFTSTSWTPTSGITYSTTVNYQAYY